MSLSVQIIADSINEFGNRLTTFQLRYPRFIHAEFMTHRMFSRNASSSRAIPVNRLIQDVIDDPAVPWHWGKNQPGMQAGEEWNAEVPVGFGSDDYVFGTREEAWLVARDNAVDMARMFERTGYHKQVVNRLLEPFAHINVVVTATEWANFFHLRDHPDAEPHIHDLAAEMRRQYLGNSPEVLHREQWHLPYVTKDEWGEVATPYRTGYDQTDFDVMAYEDAVELLRKVSVARCARVSYLTHDGRPTTITEDAALYDRLVGSSPLHASPTEHQATPDTRHTDNGWVNPDQHGNFVGWIQFRKTLDGENYTGPIA